MALSRRRSTKILTSVQKWPPEPVGGGGKLSKQFLDIMAARGIGIGSVLAGKMSASKVEYGLPPLGAICLFLTTLLFGIYGPQLFGTIVLMALAGVSSGLKVLHNDWYVTGDIALIDRTAI